LQKEHTPIWLKSHWGLIHTFDTLHLLDYSDLTNRHSPILILKYFMRNKFKWFTSVTWSSPPTQKLLSMFKQSPSPTLNVLLTHLHTSNHVELNGNNDNVLFKPAALYLQGTLMEVLLTRTNTSTYIDTYKIQHFMGHHNPITQQHKAEQEKHLRLPVLRSKEPLDFFRLFFVSVLLKLRF
jgi:hypothetical protein